ncbi:MAG TPA: hypothetical protein VHB48_02025 [Chitinophagaceae bacterium]|jgi:hypothetical protein|nr:hypothetical protein [Chitinophagaceae bacterium]
MRSLSKDDYFYMIIFSYFNKDPSARRVVGLHANSVTTDEYQAAFREGGGRPLLRWQKLPDGNGTENIHHGNTWTQPNELSLTCL